MKNHGEISVEEDVAQRVLARFGADWEEHFTRQLLAEQLGRRNHNSSGVKNMHDRISSILRSLQPPRPTTARASATSAASSPSAPSGGQQPSASPSSAPSAGNAESSSSSPANDIDFPVVGNHYAVLGYPHKP